MRQIDHNERRLSILAVSADVAKDKGLMGLRREHVADKLGIADGLISKPFGSIYKLRVALVAYAIEHELVEIVAEALVSRDSTLKNAAKKAPDAFKRRVIESLI
ncbi:hypothetical protein phiPLPE_14 [Iodobacter phage PhiPLPE]|uniref:Uncharacterized protein n=1 Tax=Iodobacter phage PhiPLPE TaxID=551895 RepID=B5AX33_9CAUD|nr:hypothetical protein phiPLPE_14 [Iodobacter phage PhiPLPE]ACG60336.1 hypothetical protein phiPLPE_14 [Iodobacter phage PhiPLPE]